KHLHDDEIVEAISYKEKPTTKIWLTKEELFMFQTFDFSRDKRLDRVRDLFVLQCHTGLRVSDLKRISRTHIKGDIIEIRAYKNSRDIRLPITPAIRGILEKYEYQLPIISDQRYNDFIKEVAEKVIPKTKIEVWQYKGGEKKKREPMKYEELSSHAA